MITTIKIPYLNVNPIFYSRHWFVQTKLYMFLLNVTPLIGRQKRIWKIISLHFVCADNVWNSETLATCSYSLVSKQLITTYIYTLIVRQVIMTGAKKEVRWRKMTLEGGQGIESKTRFSPRGPLLMSWKSHT